MIILFKTPKKLFCSPMFRDCPEAHIIAYEKLVTEEYNVESSKRFESRKSMLDYVEQEHPLISLEYLPNYRTK